jgi:TnpA family transposase
LEFYSFVADNYAPFYIVPIECNERDAPYVLDGLLYNESDLQLEEHYTDTHGYTEINFAAFAMKRSLRRLRRLANISTLAFVKFLNSTFIALTRIEIMTH